MTNDPWASALAADDAAPPKITAHQVARIVELIADYTTAEASELIVTLANRRATPNARVCQSCRQTGTHSRICPTQGDRS